MKPNDVKEPLAAHVAAFVTKTRHKDLPADAARIVKLHILDTLACGIAGVPAQGSEIVRRYIKGLGDGNATVFGTAQRAAPRFAALANATAMHADDFDDTYHPTRFHPTAPVLSAVCAVGEETGAIDQMLTKVAEAYEREVDDTVNALASILEPLLIVFLGVIIGAIVIALYLPIIQLAVHVGKN